MSTVDPSLLSTHPTNVPIVPRPLRMTEEQFVEWCQPKVFAEWVKGEVLFMSPVSSQHADIDGLLNAILRYFVEHYELGKVLGPEMQVRFATQESRRQPDLMFIATANLLRIHRHEIDGPPDAIFEIISPESQSRDRRQKFLEYQAGGVLEYWLIDLLSKTVEAYSLSNGQYVAIPEIDRTIRSVVIKKFFVRPEWFVGDTLAKLRDVLTALGV